MLSDYEMVSTREDLAAFVHRMYLDFAAAPHKWENQTLDRFLEALSAWISASPNMWANHGLPEPEQPDWAWVALALSAARYYE